MPQIIRMPKLSPTMDQGKIVAWTKKIGEEFSSGDVYLEVETDKATIEAESTYDGKIAKILVEEGASNVAIGTPIAILLEDDETEEDLEGFEIPSECGGAAKDEKPEAEAAAQSQEEPTTIDVTASSDDDNESSDQRVKISPVARRLAEQKKIPLKNLSGTGPYGRIIKRDVEGYDDTAIALKPHVISGAGAEDREEEISGMRRVIADRLVQSKQESPHFYLTLDCKMDKLLKCRKDVNDMLTADDENAPKITINDFVIKAIAMAMQANPDMNCSWMGDKILMYGSIDISVAVAIDGGLITPIVRSADKKSLSNISAEMKSLIKKAKEGSLSPEEYQGGGITISNLGMFGIKNFSAIINPPQSAILAVGASEKRPVVNDKGEIVPATIMSVSLSVDHRAIDGAVAANFIAKFKKLIENPMTMLV